MGRKKGPKNEVSSDPMEQGPLVCGAARVSGGPSACAGRSEVELGKGATANLARFAPLVYHDGFLKRSGYDVAAPHAMLARLKFENGRIDVGPHAADPPVALAGQMGVFATFL